jgi:hypothetical protein
MSKIIIIAPTAADAVKRAETIGLTRDDICIVTNLERMHGHRDMLMLYAGKTWEMPDFYDILDYATSHDIKALKSNDGTADLGRNS